MYNSKLLQSILVVMCLAMPFLATPRSASAAQITYLKAVHSLKCLDVQNGATNNGARIQQYSCNGTGSQQWEFVYAGGSARINGQVVNYYYLVNPQSGKCLDVEGGSTNNGARVQLWDCNSTGAQKWGLYDNFWTSSLTFINERSGKCLDVSAWDRNNGAWIHQWDCTWKNNQKWYWNNN